MKNRNILNKLVVIMIFMGLFSCGSHSPNVNVIKIIEGTEKHLYETSSLEELEKMHYDLLDNIKNYLDNEHDGYRYVDKSEDFEVIMERFDRYNITYCGALSKYNPELDWNKGDKKKIAHVIALMKVMENRALTSSDGWSHNR